MGALLVCHGFPPGAARGCGRAAGCQGRGEESGRRHGNKGPLVGALGGRRAIPVTELLGRRKKFPWIRAEARAGEQCQGDYGGGSLRAAGGPPDGVPAVSPLDSSGTGRGARL